MKKNILAIIGLFIPVKFEDKWVFTMKIGKVPLGWIIVIISLLMK